MRPSYLPRLVNGPFDDPGLFIPLAFHRRAILFDLGDISTLAAADLLKISHVFVSHTHMDHFIGFDRLLRLLLGRPKSVHMYGPPGFITNVRAKLGAYSWNLVQNYTEGLVVHATEIDSHRRAECRFDCCKGFEPSPLKRSTRNGSIVYEEPALQVRTAILDHQIPSLAFSLKEHFHVNILKTRLDELGLAVGPWVGTFKKHLFNSDDPETLIEIPDNAAPHRLLKVKLGELADKIARITPGQKVTYVADALYSPENEEKIIQLARHSDQLFIEAAFLEADRNIARLKHHLTAHQAGTIARKAAVREMAIFHHSPRYLDQAQCLEAEARRAFESTPLQKKD
jgi:ribonuclease Z